jgi:FkbM family methyltransferase
MSLAHRLYRLLWRQSWISLRYKKTLYKQLCQLGEVNSAPFETDFFGLRYQGNLNNGIEFALYYYGAFEKPLLFFLRDSLLCLCPDAAERQRSVFFDIGANIGQHSLFMSRYAGQVHAFEPFAAVSERLRHHIALNRIDNIQIHDVGLSDSNGSLPFYAPSGSNQGVGSFDAASTARGNSAAGELAITRADDYVAQHAIQRIDLVKIDVEGFEQKALAGFRNTLLQQRPLIVCEITYGEALSFPSLQSFRAALPPDYELLVFNTRKADGSTARRRGAKAKRSGAYELVSLSAWREQDQDDLVAVPKEKMQLLPLRNY